MFTKKYRIMLFDVLLYYSDVYTIYNEEVGYKMLTTH